MTTAQPDRPRRALVESVPIVLTPRCLRLPAIPTLADPSHPWRVARWQTGSLRFTVTVAPDGVPVALRLPRQPVSIDPPRWLPAQSISISHDFILHPTGPRRRPWFLCPLRACQRRVFDLPLLLLPDSACLCCLTCLRRQFPPRQSPLPRLSDAVHWRVYRAAVDPFAPSLSAPVRAAALPISLRWVLYGKYGKKACSLDMSTLLDTLYGVNPGL